MTEPPRLREYTEGPEALLGAAVENARQVQGSPLERRTAIYWAVRNAVLEGIDRRTTAWQRLFALRRASMAGVTVCGLAVMGILGVRWALEPSPAPHAAALAAAPPREPSPAAVEDRTVAQDARRPPAATGWTRFDIAGLGTLELASSSSELQLEELASARLLTINHGHLRAQVVRQDPAVPVVVVTPHLRVVVLGTRFDVWVDEQSTRVDLFQGRVRVESDAAGVTLEPGDSITSDDGRLRPLARAPERAEAALERAPASPPDSAGPMPSPEAPEAASGPRLAKARKVGRRAAAPSRVLPDDCERLGDAEARARCLRRVADGEGLAAQSALYSLGLLARAGETAAGDDALEVFEQYERRFPHGLMAPEVVLHRIELLRARGRTEEALEAAAGFGRRFAGDPRAPEVALLRAHILCGDPARRLEGRALLERLLEGTVLPEPVRAGAEAVQAGCGGAQAGERPGVGVP